ncbi:DUF2290 domain-containing protein [Phytopseudomonas daroniae]|nr:MULTISPECIES: DUF2290 domain-containing protein [Pseudomonas]
MSAAFDRSVRRTVDFAYEAGIALQCGPISSLKASSDFKRAARQSSSYSQVYDVGAKNQDFNLMLKDHSFFQFTETTEREDIRLAYYPNPYSFIEYQNDRQTAESMLANGDITLQEFEQLISEGNMTFDIPIIRYDLSTNQYCAKYHPAAHFHIGFKAENRWPVNRVLSPFAFFLKIIFLYHSLTWKEKGEYEKESKIENYFEEEYIRELASCSQLDDDFFQETEARRLHFR